MAWLTLGGLLLLLAIPADRGKAGRIDTTGLAALAGLAAAGWWSLGVYPPARVALVGLAWAVAGALLLLFRAALPARPGWSRWPLLGLGAAAALFALFGPADGLF